MLESHMKTFMACLNKMSEDEVMTDISLKLQDESSISCHKIVLMASCPYFETMLQSGFKESTEQEILLDFTDADTIRMLVKFFYSGEIDINEDNVQTLVVASEFLCLNDLKAHCDEFMSNLVDSANCVQLQRFGKKFSLVASTPVAEEFILKRFKDVVDAFSDFKTLTEDELAELVSSDQLNVENEDIVFEAVSRWVNVDIHERKEAFSRIAPLIRFPFCTKTTLNEVINRAPMMWNPACMELIREAQHYHLNYQHYLNSPRIVPRVGSVGKVKKPILVRTYSDTRGMMHCEHTDSIEDECVRWKEVICEQKYIRHLMTAPLGCIGLNYEKSYKLGIFKRQMWEVSWKTNIKTHDFCQYFFFNGKVYAFGCQASAQTLTYSCLSINVDEFDPKWKTEAPMLHALEHPTVVQFADKIYVLCGRDVNGSARVTQEYDPMLNEWKLRSVMPGFSRGGAAVAFNDKIYVVGGQGRSCYRYEPATDAWKVLSKPKLYYDVCSATAWKGRILVMGTNHAEEYDIERDEWLPKENLVPENLRISGSIILSHFLL